MASYAVPFQDVGRNISLQVKIEGKQERNDRFVYLVMNEKGIVRFRTEAKTALSSAIFQFQKSLAFSVCLSVHLRGH